MKVIGLLLAVTLVGSSPALAAAPTDEIRRLVSHTSRIFTDPATRDQPIERLNSVVEIIDRAFAFDEAAQLALGREWTARAAPERDEFVALFTQFVERSLLLTGASKAHLLAGARIRYLGESIARGSAIVRISLTVGEGDVIPVEFRMVERDGGWAIRDVAIDGVSLVGTLQASFDRVLRNASFADLLARMKTRTLEVPSVWAAARASAAVAPVEPPPPAAAPASVGGSASSPPPATPAPPRTTVTPPPPTVTPPPETITPPIAREAVKPREAPPSEVTRAPDSSAVASVPPAPPPPPSTTYWIQVGLFSHPDAARPLVEDLLKQALPVELAPVDLKSSRSDVRWTRVRVGPFAERAVATATLQDLARRGYAPSLATETRAARP